MVSRDDVIAAFRMFLGREPESEGAIEVNLPVPDVDELRKIFIASAEFRSKAGTLLAASSGGAVGRFRLSPALKVEVTAPADEFSRLLLHVQASWEKLGTEAPHWSVLTNSAFTPNSIDENIDQFYRSGRQSAQLYEAALARAGLSHNAAGVCFELGCGVGRITEHLAAMFKRVLAVDISEPHLDLARSRMELLGIKNVTFSKLTEIADLNRIGSFDTFFSLIVLQHNPPPIIYSILHTIFQRLNEGGLAFFQLPVYAANYSFDVKSYLAEERAQAMEMHLLPQSVLFELLRRSGMELLEIFEDSHTGLSYCSVTVFARKTSYKTFKMRQ